MIEYLDINNFIKKKADLFNFINPFFNENYRQSHNFYYILIALYKYKNYLDNLFVNVDSSIKLDINQKVAVLTQNKNILIIAGAGSGKTTTVAAKIKFMTEILKINPQKICLLSYTNQAVLEMSRIIKDSFRINTNILTFHKLALKILNNKKKIVDKIDVEVLLRKYKMSEKLMLFFYLYLFYDIKFTNLAKIFKNNIPVEILKIIEDFQKDCNKKKYEDKMIKKNIRGMLFNINYKKYVQNLSKLSENTITFDQIIENSYMINKYECYFNYLIIDEYQDISDQRLKFIIKYLKQENSKLMCVGDDWQTIFSFASSDINNILNFKKTFNDNKILKILKTYRNSQELINIAGQFIMQTPYQIKKKLKSFKSLKTPIIFVKYANKKEKIFRIEKILIQLLRKKDVKIAFLLRYKYDLDEIIDNNVFTLIDKKLYFQKKHPIFYYTVHTSKGLGFDFVFILNNENGYNGFPPKRKNITVFREERPLFEERRLYYVALTRTKNIVYIVEPNKNISKFSKEIKNLLKKNKYLI